MESIGLKNFRYAKLNDDILTYGEVKTLAGAIKCKVALELSEATLYSDDQVKEQVSVFKSAQSPQELTMMTIIFSQNFLAKQSTKKQDL